MRGLSKAAGVAILGTLMATPSMAAQRVVVWPRVIRRPVIVRPYYGPGWYGYQALGWYYPGWYYPWGPAHTVAPATGEVKIDTRLKDASVYVDGGYVGPIGKFKKFGLKPGNHDIELRDTSGQTIFDERVQVILNKTVEIRPPA